MGDDGPGRGSSLSEDPVLLFAGAFGGDDIDGPALLRGQREQRKYPFFGIDRETLPRNAHISMVACGMVPVLGALAVGLGIWGLWEWMKPKATSTSPGISLSAPLLQPGDTWMLIGDSIGQGITPYLTLLSSKHGMTLIPQTKQGSTVLSWHTSRFDNAAVFPLIVLSLGSNDAFIRNAIDVEWEKIRVWMAKLHLYAEEVAWILPPMFKAGTPSPSGPEVASMIYQSGAKVIDNYSIPIAPDGIHTTPEGYRKLAAQVFYQLTGGLS